MLVIVVEDPEGRKRRHEFKNPTVTVGRSSSNDLCIEAKGVSRQHARVSVQGRRVLIEDLQSTNGTFVNGLFAEKTFIEPGDRVSVGEMILAVTCYPEESEAEPMEQWGGVYEGSLDAAPAAEPASERDASAIDVDWHWSGNAHTAPKTSVDAEEPSEPAQRARSKSKASKSNSPKSNSSNASKSKPSVREELPAQESAEEALDQEKSAFDDFLVPIWEDVFDPAVTSVVICGTDEGYARRNGRLEEIEARFSEGELRAAALAVARFAGRTIDNSTTVLSANFPDGLSVSVLLPPFSQRGIVITICKSAARAPWEGEASRLLEGGCGDFLAGCVGLRRNILVSAQNIGWATAIMQELLTFIAPDALVIALERSEAFSKGRPRCVRVNGRGLSRRGPADAQEFQQALVDLEPDWMVIEGISRTESYLSLELMASGQCAGIIAVSAASPFQALARTEALIAREEGVSSLPLLRKRVSSYFDILIHLSPAGDGFMITSVCELGVQENEGEYDIRPIFMLDESGAELRWSGISPSFEEDLRRNGYEQALIVLQ